jgi:hypothetical protein
MLDLWAVFIFLALVTAIGSLVYLFPKRYRRRAKWVLACSVVWLVVSFVTFGITSDRMNREAQRLGYSGWQARRAAERGTAKDEARPAQAEKEAAVSAEQRANEAKRLAVGQPTKVEQAAAPTARPTYCSGTGTELLPECGWTEEKQKAADAAASRAAPTHDSADEGEHQRAFNCAVLRDAVDEANQATANAERYGVHETVSQAMQIDRAEATLQSCR